MIGATRATTTLLAVALAGFLFWVGAQIVDPLGSDANGLSVGEYWLWIATLAAAGFVMALAQLVGGWTKWGWPRISLPVFVAAFLPALAAGLWILFFHQTAPTWLSTHVQSWSNDIGIDHLVGELGIAVPAIGFALGLLFGLTFDTTGPTIAPAAVTEEPAEPVTAVQNGPRAEPAEPAEPVAVGADGADGARADEPRVTTPRDES